MWILHAKRFDYSYQPNAPREPGSTIPNDQTETGLIASLSGNTGWPPEDNLPLPEDIRSAAWGSIDSEAKQIWDYDNSIESNDAVYGGYGKGGRENSIKSISATISSSGSITYLTTLV